MPRSFGGGPDLPDEAEHPDRRNRANLVQVRALLRPTGEIFMAGEAGNACIATKAATEVEREILALAEPERQGVQS